MVFLEFGTIRNAQNLQEPIKSLCAAIGINGSLHLVHEFSDGFSETRVVMGEHRSSPDAPQPFRFVFKIGAANILRDEILRYLDIAAHGQASAAFVPIWKAEVTINALPTDATPAAIAYGHASDVFGARDCLSFKNLFCECIEGKRPVSEIAGIIDSLARVLASLYSEPHRCFAHEVASYYLEHWAPDYQVAADCIVDRESRPLLTLQRLNPDYFRKEDPNFAANLRQEAELPPDVRSPDIALPTCTVADIKPERLEVIVNSADDLALYVDTRDLSSTCLAKISKGSTISLWVPRRLSRYEFYLRQVSLALPSLNIAAPSFRVGPLRVHNPLLHFSAPLLAATKPLAFTWAVPGHGDLHPGNVLIVGTSPAIIDYGKSTLRIPIGVDASRFFGGLVRDVLAEVLSFEDLAMVLADSLGLGSFVEEADSPASRAVFLLKQIFEKLVPSGAPYSKTQWFIHLYGYAWIGLKWPHSSPQSYGGCFLLAGLALQVLLGEAPTEEKDSPEEEKLPLPPTAMRPIKPEGSAEILILVSRFEGSADYDPTARIYSSLADHVFELIPELARVERAEEVISSRKDAVELAGRYNASMIVWGTFDNYGVSPHYEVTRDSLVVKRSMIQLDQATRHQLSERFNTYITQNLGAEISLLSLVAVAGMCELNLNLEDSIKIYKRALSLISDPDRAIALGVVHIYHSLAALYFALNRDIEAIEANNKARELVPNDLSTELQRLQIQSRIEKKPAGQQIQDLKNLLHDRIQANEDSPEMIESLREVFEKLGPLQTPADFVKLLKTDSESNLFEFSTVGHNQYKKDVAIHLERARQLFNNNKYKKCFAEIKSALRLNPRCAEAFFLRGAMLAYLDRIAESIKDLDKAEKINPKMGKLYYIRGNIFYNLGEFSKALCQFERGLELDTPRTLSMPEWGKTMVELHRGDEAMQALRDMEMDPSNTDLFNFRSYYYYKDGKFEVALREINQAIELSITPDDFAANYKDRAAIYVAMGCPDLAIKDLECAMEKSLEGTHLRRTIHEQMIKLRGDESY